MGKVISSETVMWGHPDKVCDYISDSILDCALSYSSNAKVAIETMTGVSSGKAHIILSGQMSPVVSDEEIDHIVSKCIKHIGYREKYKDLCGFYPEMPVLKFITKQSDDINRAVDKKAKSETGAGDQGMMYGYATNETEEFLPTPFVLSRNITNALSELIHKGEYDFLLGDGKAQVTVEYFNNFCKTKNIVVSVQNTDDYYTKEVVLDIVSACCDKMGMAIPHTDDIYINPSGKFEIGGCIADTGLTGRKIIADTYGGFAHHGGGAFSGKDGTKVDRSGAYMARKIAKSIVRNGFADKCEIGISYAIGKKEALSLNINTFGTGKIPAKLIHSYVKNTFDLTPNGIIESLGLGKPIFADLALIGHFGNEGYTWEL